MFFSRQFSDFIFKHLEGANQLFTRLVRIDHLIDIAAMCSPIGMSELTCILLHFLVQFCLWIGSFGDLLSENNLGRTLGTHHSNLGRWPGVVEIGANVFGVHHIISAAVSLARNDGDTWYGCLRE